MTVVGACRKRPGPFPGEGNGPGLRPWRTVRCYGLGAGWVPVVSGCVPVVPCWVSGAGAGAVSCVVFVSLVVLVVLVLFLAPPDTPLGLVALIAA